MSHSHVRTVAAIAWGALALLAGAAPAGAAAPRDDVLPSLQPNLVSFYDLEHPAPGDAAQELDQGASGTTINLVNGGAAMRVPDGAYRGSTQSIQTQQVDPVANGNDDWKAGVFSQSGVPTMRAFNHARQITIMGWFKPTGENPSPNTVSANPSDFYGAVGLAGVLTGDSDGHAVRALLEVIDVNGTLRVVALGRRVDGGSSQTFAANEDWHQVLPSGRWTFLAATFDYDTGEMRLYKDGRPLSGFYTLSGDPWAIAGPPEPDFSTASDPRGIKIGGSFPQNTLERNPCNCRFDGLMFLDRAVTSGEIRAQHERVVR
jgi:hypothetical protein